MNLNFRRNAGATLIEVIMVVALIALIIIGSLLYYNTASHASKVREAVSSIGAKVTILQNMYATQPSYSGISELVVVNSGSVQHNIKSTLAGELKHPWDQTAGAVTVSVDPVAMPLGSAFRITYNFIPKGACVDIASQAFSSFPAIYINGVQLSNAGTGAIVCVDGSINSIGFVQS